MGLQESDTTLLEGMGGLGPEANLFRSLLPNTQYDLGSH